MFYTTIVKPSSMYLWRHWHIYFLLLVLMEAELSMTKTMEPFCQKATEMANKYKLTF